MLASNHLSDFSSTILYLVSAGQEVDATFICWPQLFLSECARWLVVAKRGLRRFNPHHGLFSNASDLVLVTTGAWWP